MIHIKMQTSCNQATNCKNVWNPVKKLCDCFSLNLYTCIMNLKLYNPSKPTISYCMAIKLWVMYKYLKKNPLLTPNLME